MPEAYLLRPFTPDDYPAFLSLGRLAFGDDGPMDEETLRRLDKARDPAHPRGRILAAREEDGQVLGMANWTQARGTQDIRFWIIVRPEHRRQGIGSALYTAVLEETAPHNPLSLLVGCREDRLEALSFLQHRGFLEAMRGWGSRLTLADFHPERFAGIEEGLDTQGIVIRTFAEVDAGEPDARQRVYELVNALWQDVPLSVPFVPQPFETWQQRTVEDTLFLPQAFFIAQDTATGEFIGVSTLSRLPDSQDLHTGLTGVRREYRRRNIALALKVRAARYAHTTGAPVIRTGNASTNVGMLAINDRLGFQRETAARITFTCKLPPPLPPAQPELLGRDSMVYVKM